MCPSSPLAQHELAAPSIASLRTQTRLLVRDAPVVDVDAAAANQPRGLALRSRSTASTRGSSTPATPSAIDAGVCRRRHAAEHRKHLVCRQRRDRPRRTDFSADASPLARTALLRRAPAASPRAPARAAPDASPGSRARRRLELARSAARSRNVKYLRYLTASRSSVLSQN